MLGPKAKMWKEEGEVPRLTAGGEQSSPEMGWEALGGLWQVSGVPLRAAPHPTLGPAASTKREGEGEMRKEEGRMMWWN